MIYYDVGANAVEGSGALHGMKSVTDMCKDKGDVPLPENESVTPENIQALRQKLKKDQVWEIPF